MYKSKSWLTVLFIIVVTIFVVWIQAYAGNERVTEQNKTYLKDSASGYKIGLVPPTTILGSWNFTLPEDAGTANQVLATDGSGNTYWTAQSGAGGANTSLSNLTSTSINTSLIPSSDGSDNLGSVGNYWLNGFIDLLSVASIYPKTHQTSPMGGSNLGYLDIWTHSLGLSELAANGTNYLQINAPSSMTSNVAWTLPATQGSAGTVLQNDGSGNLSWSTVSATPAGSSGQVQFNSSGSFGASSNLTIDATNSVLTVGAGAAGTRGIIIGNTSNNASTYLYFKSDTTNTTSAYISKDGTGANANMNIVNHGNGALFITAAEAGSIALQTTGTTRLGINSVGALTANSIHNNCGNICSGTWTPTLTSATAPAQGIGGKYTRVGNIVSFSFWVNSASSTFYVTLPIASNLTSQSDLLGTCSNPVAYGCYATGDTTNDRIQVFVDRTPPSTTTFLVTGQYVVQ